MYFLELLEKLDDMKERSWFPLCFYLPFGHSVCSLSKNLKITAPLVGLLPFFPSLSIWWLHSTTIKIQNGSVKGSCVPTLLLILETYFCSQKRLQWESSLGLRIWTACFICCCQISYFITSCLLCLQVSNFLMLFPLNRGIQRVCARGRASFLSWKCTYLIFFLVA